MRAFPAVIRYDNGEEVYLPSTGYLLKFLRQKHYRNFRHAHIQGYKGCPTWWDIAERIGARSGWQIVSIADTPQPNEPKDTGRKPTGGS